MSALEKTTLFVSMGLATGSLFSIALNLKGIAGILQKILEKM